MTFLKTNPVNSWLRVSLAAILVSFPAACAFEPNTFTKAIEPKVKAETKPAETTTSAAAVDVQALVNMGARVTGTPVMEKASNYISEQYRKAGYKTQIQTFTYSKFTDLGSNVVVDGTTIEAQALKGSVPAKLDARAVVVPNFGRANDFTSVDVKDAIAIVKRGEIRFGEKARNAANAGAVGLIIVNNKPGNLAGGALTEVSKIPVLGISSAQGNLLINRTEKNQINIKLNANGQNQVVTGRNVIAYLDGVTQPQIILGGHYDSVAGAPGANDNASGTATVLAIARNLSGTPLARQAWFLAFDGEEDGLHGSVAFVKAAAPQFLTGLKAMMNFDMVGVNNQLQIGGTSSLTGLAKVVEPKVELFSGSAADGGSDHASFAAKGVPILFFYRGYEPNYHTPNDKTVDPKLLDETTQVGLDIFKRLLRSS
jgi:aminopeptidase YwaD